MKKIFALLLAIVMVMGLATVASAETVNTTGWKSEVETVELVLNKIYTVTGQSTTGAIVVPDETLTFTSTPDQYNPTTADLTIAAIDDANMTDKDGKKVGTMSITLPVYEKTGVYNYVIKETAGSAQAATYSTAEIGVQVLVTYDYTNSKLATAISLTTTGTNDDDSLDVDASDATKWKLDTFENNYNMGVLEVKKTVSGNLAAKDVEFKMTVKFSSDKDVKSDITIVDTTNAIEGNEKDSETSVAKNWTKNETTGKYEKTATIYVRADETVTFQDVPVGVAYEVVEDPAHAAEDSNSSNPETGYTATYTGKTGSISATKSTATVNNDKDKSVDTGIVMDSVPFVVMAVIAVLGLAAFTAKKRVQE